LNPDLKLRDIHLPAEPSWWPPAPGWWVLALVLLLALALLTRRVLRRRRERRRVALLIAEFDSAVAIADPSARLAAVSQLLRRAARQRDPSATQLRGEAWLEFLAGVDRNTGDHPVSGSSGEFSGPLGRLLLDGPYQAHADATAVDALIEPARRRFLSLVTSQ
jgi:HAMP domain-containing protein